MSYQQSLQIIFRNQSWSNEYTESKNNQNHINNHCSLYQYENRTSYQTNWQDYQQNFSFYQWLQLIYHENYQNVDNVEVQDYLKEEYIGEYKKEEIYYDNKDTLLKNYTN